MTLVLHQEWIPTQAEFDLFAQISGDDNPIHVDPEFSARTRFGRTVSHGMLIYSKIWQLLMQHYPGARQVRQEMMFSSPCFVGDVVDLHITQQSANAFSLRAIRREDDAELLTGLAELE